MTYEKLISVLRSKAPVGSNLNQMIFVDKANLKNDITIYDPESREYYAADLRLSADDGVLDEGHLVFVMRK